MWDVAPGGNCSVPMAGSISSFVNANNKVTTSYLRKRFLRVLLLV